MRDLKKYPSRTGLVTMAVIAGLAATLTCVCSLAALYLLQQVGSLPPLITMWRPTAMPTSTAPPSLATPTQVSTRALTATVTPTVTPTPSSTPTRRPSSTPTATRTPRPTSTLTPTSTPATAASPTPFVCQDMEDLSTMQLAPGQRFECTIQEEAFTALANSYAESPCSETRFRFDNGEIQVQCRMGLTMSAALEAKARNCRVALRVLRGTFGFTGIVEEMIRTQLDSIRYDNVCVEQVNVDDGAAYIAGQGR